MAKRSWEKRRAKAAAFKTVAPLPAISAMPNAPALEDGGYSARTLTRVRKQVKLVQDAIDKALMAEEAKPLKDFTDALSRLAEIERQLAGRPLPGSLRPKQEKSKRITTQAEPDEA